MRPPAPEHLAELLGTPAVLGARRDDQALRIVTRAMRTVGRRSTAIGQRLVPVCRAHSSLIDHAPLA
jgi:hypothetical protein